MVKTLFGGVIIVEFGVANTGRMHVSPFFRYSEKHTTGRGRAEFGLGFLPGSRVFGLWGLFSVLVGSIINIIFQSLLFIAFHSVKLVHVSCR